MSLNFSHIKGDTFEEVNFAVVKNSTALNLTGAIFTDVQQGSFSIELQQGEEQNLASAELYSKLAFEQMEYKVENE